MGLPGHVDEEERHVLGELLAGGNDGFVELGRLRAMLRAKEPRWGGGVEMMMMMMIMMMMMMDF